MLKTLSIVETTYFFHKSPCSIEGEDNIIPFSCLDRRFWAGLRNPKFLNNLKNMKKIINIFRLRNAVYYEGWEYVSYWDDCHGESG